MNNKNIILEFWEHIETNKQNKKICNSIYNWLNRDNLGSIIVDNNIYYTELVGYSSVMPNYIYYYIKRWAKKRGLTYLYDL